MTRYFAYTNFSFNDTSWKQYDKGTFIIGYDSAGLYMSNNVLIPYPQANYDILKITTKIPLTKLLRIVMDYYD